MKYLLFLSLLTYQIYGMNNVSEESFPRRRSVFPLKIIAAQRVHELGLLGNDPQKNTLDDVFFEECRVMPETIVNEHAQRMLANVERNNGIAPEDKRVQEMIYTYNSITYINKRLSINLKNY